MKKLLMLCLLASTSAIAAARPSHFFCRIASGESFEGWALNGDIVVDWNGRGDWQKAFGAVDGSMITVTQIGAGGMAVLAWQTQTHEAYVITSHNGGGKVQNHAYCSWKN